MPPIPRRSRSTSPAPVQLRRRRRRRHSSLGRRDEIELHRTQAAFETLEGHQKYSFLKTRAGRKTQWRWAAGTVARAFASGRTDVQELVKETLGKLNVPVAALFSTLAVPRLEAGCGAGHDLAQRVLRPIDGAREDQRGLHLQRREVGTKSWPSEAEGVGLTEAPRGALAHWIKIKNGAIDNYQLVVPTTWNGSPRDAKQQRSSLNKR